VCDTAAGWPTSFTPEGRPSARQELPGPPWPLTNQRWRRRPALSTTNRSERPLPHDTAAGADTGPEAASWVQPANSGLALSRCCGVCDAAVRGACMKLTVTHMVPLPATTTPTPAWLYLPRTLARWPGEFMKASWRRATSARCDSRLALVV